VLQMQDFFYRLNAFPVTYSCNSVKVQKGISTEVSYWHDNISFFLANSEAGCFKVCLQNTASTRLS